MTFRDLPREVTALCAVAFCVAVGFGILIPAVPRFAAQFGVSAAAAGLVISAFAFTRLASAPFAGKFVNAFGERWVLAIGIGIVAVSSALAGCAQEYWQLLVLRGLGGAGSVMFTVSSASVLIRVTRPQIRGQAQGLYTGSFLIGGLVGPLAGGAVAGVSLRLPFFIYAAVLAVAGTVGLVMLRRAELAATGLGPVDEPTITTLRAALAVPEYITAVATALCMSFAVMGMRLALVPLFLERGLHYDKVATGWWAGISFFIVGAVSMPLLMPVGRYSDNHGRWPVLLTGISVAFVALALLAIWPSLPGLLISSVLLGAESALLTTAPAAMVGDVVGSRGGTVVAVYQMSGDVGILLGGAGGGALADAFGYSAAFGVSAGVLLLPLVVAAVSRSVSRARALSGTVAE